MTRHFGLLAASMILFTGSSSAGTVVRAVVGTGGGYAASSSVQARSVIGETAIGESAAPGVASCAGFLCPVFGFDCFTFEILSIADVGNDQGRQVRIRWCSHGDDDPGATEPVTSYSVYRRIEDGLRAETATTKAGAREPLTPQPGGEDWDYLLTVPGGGEIQYASLATTLCDSTLTDGQCLSTFRIRAHTDDPFVFEDTPEASGYSLDNLAPGIPRNFFVNPNTLVLRWDPVDDADWRHYTIYGSESDELDGSETLILHTVAELEDVSASPFAYYFITASDFAGNEGDAARAVPQVDVPEPLPTVPALMAARPNPFGTRTIIPFDVPRAGHVRLRIFDLQGRLVRTLREGAEVPGRHRASWSGERDGGGIAPAGVYFYTFELGDYRHTRKLTRVY